MFSEVNDNIEVVGIWEKIAYLHILNTRILPCIYAKTMSIIQNS